MRGNALETTVLDSMATNIARSRPDIDSSTSRWVIAPERSTALSSGASEMDGGVVVSGTAFLMCAQRLSKTTLFHGGGIGQLSGGGVVSKGSTDGSGSTDGVRTADDPQV